MRNPRSRECKKTRYLKLWLFSKKALIEYIYSRSNKQWTCFHHAIFREFHEIKNSVERITLRKNKYRTCYILTHEFFSWNTWNVMVGSLKWNDQMWILQNDLYNMRLTWLFIKRYRGSNHVRTCTCMAWLPMFRKGEVRYNNILHEI